MEGRGVVVKFTRMIPEANAPTRGSQFAAGWDLKSLEKTTISKGFSSKVRTGLKVAIPNGWEGQIRARSSLASKGLILPNAPATIDADYRGELMVLVTWIGDAESFIVESGERIAQLIISKVPEVSFVEVSEIELGDTERGDGGFGSTGKF